MTTEKKVMQFKDVNKYERYDYPGEYGDKGVGAPLARIRMEELEIEHNLVSGSSGCKSMSPGHRFTVGRHRSKSEEGKTYVVKKIHHEAREPTYETGASNGMDYGNHFECFPAAATFVPLDILPSRSCVVARQRLSLDRLVKRSTLMNLAGLRFISLGPRRAIQRQEFLLDSCFPNACRQRLGIH